MTLLRMRLGHYKPRILSNNAVKFAQKCIENLITFENVCLVTFERKSLKFLNVFEWFLINCNSKFSDLHAFTLVLLPFIWLTVFCLEIILLFLFFVYLYYIIYCSKM